jgi:hypothetical protein
MSHTFKVESRIVAYESGKELPHVFASVRSDVTLDQLDNSQLTVDAFDEGAKANGQELIRLLETVLHNEPPHLVDQLDNVIDSSALRTILKAVDEGRARIVASCITNREPGDAVWYCIKVKKL